MIIPIFGSKSGLVEDFRQSDIKTLRNSVAMATPKVQGDHKLYEWVCYAKSHKVSAFNT